MNNSNGTWHKADAVTWRKSQRSLAHGDCVELACHGEDFAIRDSKNPAGPVLAPFGANLPALLAAVKAGAVRTRG
jgi:hypothetical protein